MRDDDPNPYAAPASPLTGDMTVVLHNDDINTVEYVVRVLRGVFGYGISRAVWLTLKAHVSGRCVVWSGTRELAELKAEQVRKRGPDPSRIAAGALPLRVTVEPARGDT